MTDPSCYIEIAFTRIRDAFPDNIYRDYFARLPVELQKQNQQYVRWQDRHAHLMGKILLLSASMRMGTGERVLSELKYNAFGKPIWDHLRFNISHSGEFVVCAATTSNLSLGVDVELKKPVDFADFRNTMSPVQWEFINQIPGEALDRFYSYWVIKESVIKAEGGGLSVPLTDIYISENIASLRNRLGSWHIAEVSIAPDYAMAIATSLAVRRENIYIREFETPKWARGS